MVLANKCVKRLAKNDEKKIRTWGNRATMRRLEKA